MKRLAVYFTVFCTGVVANEAIKKIYNFAKKYKTVEGETNPDILRRGFKIIDDMLAKGNITKEEYDFLNVVLMYFDYDEFKKDYDYDEFKKSKES